MCATNDNPARAARSPVVGFSTVCTCVTVRNVAARGEGSDPLPSIDLPLQPVSPSCYGSITGRIGISSSGASCPGAAAQRSGGERVRAVVYDRYGPPDVLRIEDVERPVPWEDEVLVKIYATTVSRSD